MLSFKGDLIRSELIEKIEQKRKQLHNFFCENKKIERVRSPDLLSMKHAFSKKKKTLRPHINID